MSGTVLVIAVDDKGTVRAVGPVMPRHVERLRAAVAAHGWQVTGIANHMPVYAFRALARRGGGRR